MLAATKVKIGDATRVLSGGAREVAAGGGFPLRVTTAAISTFVTGSPYSLYCGVCWDADGLHVWHAQFNADGNKIRKWRISDGTSVANFAPGGTIRGITRDGAGKLIVCGYGSKAIYVVEPSTMAVEATVTPAGGVSPGHYIRMADGKFWGINGSSGTAIEYNSDGTATTRTVAGTWTGIYLHPSIPGYFYLFASAGVIQRVAHSDLAALAFTVGTSKWGLPGESGYTTSGCVDQDGRLYCMGLLRNVVDEWPAAGGSATRRVLWPDVTLGVPQFKVYDAANIASPLVAFSDDGQWMAWKVSAGAGTDWWNAIRARCVGTQRARYTVTWDHDVSISSIVVPGLLGRTQDATTDYRATRCYYSTDGGSTRTEFVPGDVLTPIAGRELTVDIDFCLLGIPPAADPYIGDTDGNAFVVYADDPAVVGPSYADPTSATTLAAIRAALKAQILGLTPTTRKDVLFHPAPPATTWAEWLAANKGSQSFRIFSIERDPDSETEELPLHSPSARFVDDWLLLRVAYPLAPGLYGPEGWEDLEDVLEGDADQLAGRAENSQYYLAGQVQTSAEERALDRTDGVAVLTIRLRCRYYKTRGA